MLTTHEYDHAGRLVETKKKVNSQSEILQGRLEYNGIGQLVRKRLHSENGGTNFIDTVAYTYNERGWMTKIGSPYFTQEMRYADPVSGTAQYNGNIAQLRWGHGTTVSETINYGYDRLNRLLSGVKTGTVMSEVLEYDDMGNITKLTRDNGTAISYAYTGNRLSSLSGGLTGSYTYDANGNATLDRTGMAFSYNHLNLPKTAAKTGTSVSYVYDALGNKLHKAATVGSVATQRDYVAGIEYSKVGSGASTIELIHTEEGYLQNSGGTYTYHYNLTDHLGNVRATLQRTTATTGTVIQKHDYYPFGKAKALATSGVNKYLYNGKEIQEEIGGQYDYGARFYDAEIGRWNVVDPLADKYDNFSPYNYVANNPIIAIDPDGKDIIFVVGDKNYTYRQGNLYVNNQMISTVPRTDGRYTFLSNDQQAVLNQYRHIEASGDKVLMGSLHTLVNSKNKHFISVGGSDKQSAVDAIGSNSQNAQLEYSDGSGSDSEANFNFSASRRRGWSDLELVFHEMRHQLDIDKGKLPSMGGRDEVTRRREQNAVSSQNYVRKKEGKAPLDNYSNQYFYSKESLDDSHNKLLELIQKAMSQSGNSTIYFY